MFANNLVLLWSPAVDVSAAVIGLECEAVDFTFEIYKDGAKTSQASRRLNLLEGMDTLPKANVDWTWYIDGIMRGLNIAGYQFWTTREIWTMYLEREDPEFKPDLFIPLEVCRWIYLRGRKQRTVNQFEIEHPKWRNVKKEEKLDFSGIRKKRKVGK